MNGEYLRAMTPEQLFAAAKPFIDEAGIAKNANEEFLKKVILLEQEKYKTLKEIPDLISFFFTDEVKFDEQAVNKVFKQDTAKKALETIKAKYEALPDFSETALEAAAREAAKENNLKAGQVFHPLRVAVSGRTNGPTLFKMLEYMGKDMVLKRIEAALELC
jgi:glutamyl/glutaminyl-tRNA synthetase